MRKRAIGRCLCRVAGIAVPTNHTDKILLRDLRLDCIKILYIERQRSLIFEILKSNGQVANTRAAKASGTDAAPKAFAQKLSGLRTNHLLCSSRLVTAEVTRLTFTFTPLPLIASEDTVL